jgi:hypothetical protein
LCGVEAGLASKHPNEVVIFSFFGSTNGKVGGGDLCVCSVSSFIFTFIVVNYYLFIFSSFIFTLFASTNRKVGRDLCVFVRFH